MAQSTFNLPCTFAAGASQSSLLKPAGAYLQGIWVPTGWTAANITFLATPDPVNVTAQSCFDQNGVEIIAVVNSTGGYYVPIAPTLLESLMGLYLRSGTSGSPVTQVSAATLNCLFKTF